MQQTIDNNAEFCGKIPLHQINTIQPHGVVLLLDKKELKVIQLSENAEIVFDKPARQLLNVPVAELLPHDAIQQIQTFITSIPGSSTDFSVSLGEANYPGRLEVESQYFLLELEPDVPADVSQSFSNWSQSFKQLTTALGKASSITEATSIAARMIKEISGFDKVMIYRFDESWNGDVVAEEKEAEMESYLGLKFPATDVPKPARDLYKIMPYRFIPNVHYKPVKLYPVLNPATGSFTDLTKSNLRSVAAVHLEYLTNMQVAASMSTRILMDGELWGLIACHHRTPRQLPGGMRAFFELASNFISAKFSEFVSRSQAQVQLSKQDLLLQICDELLQGKSIKDCSHHLLPLLEADGIAIPGNGTLQLVGLTPGIEQMEELLLWLQVKSRGQIFATDSLAAVFEPGQAYCDDCSGLLSIPMGNESFEHMVVFRKELTRQINWGGDPKLALQFEPGGMKYHPRTSFQVWKQTVMNTSLPWTLEVMEAANRLRRILSGKR